MKASYNRPSARPSPPPASSMPSTWAPVMTGFVVASQLAFVVTAYSHAYLDSALTRNKFHISAVLDHDVRSTICACVGLAGLFSLVMLERCRALPRPKLRACLAATCGGGIIATCTVRESQYVNGHRCTAMVAFGAAVALVWIVAALARDARGRRAASMLVALVVTTGCAQGLNIVGEENFGIEVLPSWALGCLELGLIFGFTLCICTSATAGGGDGRRQKRDRSESPPLAKAF